MSYFKPLGKLQYNLFGNNTKLQNLIKSANPTTLLNSVILRNYTVNEQSPEQVAIDLYNDASAFWVILYVNSIVNPYSDWPLNSTDLYNFCIEKYGKINVISPHHFINNDTGLIVDDYYTLIYKNDIENNIDLPTNITIISNYQYELTLNQSKKNIVVVPQQYLVLFENTYLNIIGGK